MIADNRVARWFLCKTQNPKFGQIFGENVDTFYDQWEYFTGIWDIL
jgi:hypothetical protein